MMVVMWHAVLLIAWAGAAREEPTTIFRASHVLTSVSAPLTPADIEVVGDRIAWVGLPRAASSDVPVHDLGEAWVTPGFIDSGWHAFPPRLSVGTAPQPGWQWSDVLDRRHPLRPVAWRGGVTAAVAVPSSRAVVDGWAPLVRFARSGIVVVEARAILCGRIGGTGSLEGDLEATSTLIALLSEAERLRSAWEVYDRQLDRYREAQTLGLAAPDPPRPPSERHRWTRLADVLDGRRPLRLEGARAEVVRRLLDADGLEGIRYWLVGEWKPESLERSDRFLASLPPRAALRRNLRSGPGAEWWLEHGFEVAFASQDLGDPSYLRFEGARAIAEGASREEVLAALTIVPAQQLGVEESLGSIAAGRIADLVVWSGDPFDPRSRVRAVIVGGQWVPLSSDR